MDLFLGNFKFARLSALQEGDLALQNLQ